jgi:hypothetical protein
LPETSRQISRVAPHVCFRATVLMALYKAAAQSSGNLSGETPLSLHYKLKGTKKTLVQAVLRSFVQSWAAWESQRTRLQICVVQSNKCSTHGPVDY